MEADNEREDFNQYNWERMDKVARERYNKSAVAGIFKKRMETAFIGALYEFEQTFGYIWGNRKNYDELTENQKKYREMWEFTRKRILDNGNNQVRNGQQEIQGL